MSLDAAAIAGLKVAELKAELEQRGLPTGGKKADLAARLTEAVANEAAVEEEAPAAVEEEAPAAVEEEEQGQEEEAPVATEEEPVEVAPAATDDSAAAPAAAGEEVDEAQLDAFELAKKKRAERFGIPYHPPKKASDPPEDEDPIEAIKRQRAERFGLPYEPPKKGKNKRKSDGPGGGQGKKGKKLAPEDEEALKKRAERFQKAPVDPAEEARRLARAARFGS